MLLEHMPHDSHFGGHLGCLSQALEVGVHVLPAKVSQITMGEGNERQCLHTNVYDA